MFMRIGLPCRHVFQALFDLSVDYLPNNLVLPRWTKAATSSASVIVDDDVVQECDQMETRRKKINALRMEFNSYMRLIEDDDKRIDEFASLVKECKVHFADSVGETIKKSFKRNLMEEFIGTSIPDDVSIKNPDKAINKGSGKRIRSLREQLIEKSKKGTRK